MIPLDEVKVEGGVEKKDISNSSEMCFTIVSKVNMGGSRHSVDRCLSVHFVVIIYYNNCTVTK